MSDTSTIKGNPRSTRYGTIMHRTGLIFIAVSAIAFLVDRFTHVLSDTLGKGICREQYLQPVNGIVGDQSCGFNTDMYLAVFLAMTCLTGIMLVVFSRNNRIKK